MYIGETSRSSHERGGEHQADYRKRLPDSHILKHQQADHQGHPEAVFQFRVSATFQSALTRQITEAVMLRRLGEGSALNSKGMFNRCSLPRLTVLDDRKGEKDQVGVDSSPEFDNEKWPGTGWDRKRSKQPDVYTRRERKKLKIDHQTLLEENPRQEGLEKRKICFETEHERECKRLRPEFEPEEELRSLTEVKPTPIQISKPVVLFDIFVKPNKQTFKKFEKSKAKLTPSSKKKKSLTTVAARQGPSILTYFKQNQNHENQAVLTAVVATPAEQLSGQGGGGKEKTKFNCGVRGEESGVTWEPRL